MQTNTPTLQGDPTAVMGRRIVAYLIDLVIAMVLMGGLFAAVADHATARSADAAQRACDIITSSGGDSCFALGSDVYVTTSGESSLIFLVGLAYGLFFHVLLPGINGFSPGKGVMGLRIVKKDDGTIAGIGANAVRWLLLFVDTFPWVLPLVGLVTASTSKGHRRVGDMAAGTLVVRREAVGQVPAVPGLTTSTAVTGSWSPPAPTGSWAPPTPAPPPAPPGAAPGAPSPGAPPTPPPAPPSTPPSGESGAAPPFAPPAPPTAGEPGGSAGGPAGGSADVDADDTAETPVAASGAGDAPDGGSPDAGASRPGVDAPLWDEARNTYIQWDPELQKWMEWDEANGRWIPIST